MLNNRYFLPTLVTAAILIFAIGTGLLLYGVLNRRAPRPIPTPIILIPTPQATGAPGELSPVGTGEPVAGNLESPRPTGSITVTLTPTATLDPTRFTPTPKLCPTPPGWVTYTIQRGDTLFKIAQLAGSSVDSLAEANCIEDPSIIEVDQVIYVPQEVAPSPSPPVTGTATVTLSVTVGPTVTATVSSTATASATATPTVSPTPTATAVSNSGEPEGIAIVAFNASAQSVSQNSSLTLSWEVTGEGSVFINQRFQNGALERVAEVAPGSGSRTIDVGQNPGTLAFFLVVQDGAGRTAQRELSTEIVCNIPLFVAPTDPLNHCPGRAALDADASYQPFENGFMLWHRLRNGEYQIVAFSDDGSYSGPFEDRWDGEDIDFAESPPAGLEQPTMGFGRVWVDQSEVRERLGWASAFENAYQATAQQLDPADGAGVGDIFVTLPDGRVIRYGEQADAGKRWNFVEVVP